MEQQHIADLVDRIMIGDPWHGSSVRDLLADISGADAARRPLAAGHSVWEVVLHMTGWAREVTARLGGQAAQEPDEGDWPDVGAPDEARWRAATAALFDAHRALASAIRTFDPARLHEPVLDYRSSSLGTGLSFYLTLHGVIQHTVYHAGQIALLKKGYTGPEPSAPLNSHATGAKALDSNSTLTQGTQLRRGLRRAAPRAMSDQRLKIAVFIDFDNVEIGVKTTLGLQFDIGAVLEAIKERGEIITKVAYGDWKRAGDHGRAMSQHAVRLVQRVMTPGGDKNGADINLALDALEMAFTHDHINAFVIVGGDSDFITLVEKLKQYDKKVFVVGGRAFTSQVMQKNCTEFIAYENVTGGASARAARRRAERRRGAAPARRARARRGRRRGAALDQALPLVKRALEGAGRSRSLAAARACSRARCCSSTPRSPSATTARARSATSPRSSKSTGWSR